jgi:hypothetical protein
MSAEWQGCHLTIKRVGGKSARKLTAQAGRFVFTVIVAWTLRWLDNNNKRRLAGFEAASPQDSLPRVVGGHLFMPCLGVGFYKLLPLPDPPVPSSHAPVPRWRELHIVFDGLPAHESCRFVEVETASGKSVSVGRWEKNEKKGGLWSLILTVDDFKVKVG